MIMDPFESPIIARKLVKRISKHKHTCKRCDVNEYIDLIEAIYDQHGLWSDNGMYEFEHYSDIIYCLSHIFKQGVSYDQQQRLSEINIVKKTSIPIWCVALIESEVILYDNMLLVIKKHRYLQSLYDCSKKNIYTDDEWVLIINRNSKKYFMSKFDKISFTLDDPKYINIIIEQICQVYVKYMKYNIIKQLIIKYKEFISDEIIQYIFINYPETVITLAEYGVIINTTSLDILLKYKNLEKSYTLNNILYNIISKYDMRLTFYIFKYIYTFNHGVCDITKKNLDENNVDSILVHFYASIVYDNIIELHKIINKYNKIVFSQESLEKAYILRSDKCIQYILNNKIIPTNNTFINGHQELFNKCKPGANGICEIEVNLVEGILFGFIPDKMTINALIPYNIIIPEISRFNIDPTDIFKICVKHNYFPKEYTIIMENNIQLKFRLMHNNKKTSYTTIEKYMKQHEIDIDEYCILLCFKNNKILFNHYKNNLKLDIPLVCLLMDPIKDIHKEILINYIDKNELFNPFI